jgi:hypothetical protein
VALTICVRSRDCRLYLAEVSTGEGEAVIEGPSGVQLRYGCRAQCFRRFGNILRGGVSASVAGARNEWERQKKHKGGMKGDGTLTMLCKQTTEAAK